MPHRPKRLYDHLWERVAKEVLVRDQHRCYFEQDGVRCPTRATNVDHIIPVEEAPHLRLVKSNLRASCNPHNYGRANRRAAQLIRVSRSPGVVRKW